MGTRETSTTVKKVKLARCSICRKIPTADCDWRQGRCPHKEPTIGQAVIHNFINFFRRKK
jgi:hypothetical protein